MGMKGGHLLKFLSGRARVVFIAGILLFLWCVSQFYQRDTGFSSLISIGDMLTATKVTALKQSPHYVYESSPGYDGAYYVQLALYPTLDNPELTKAIDNLPYRAKRILFCWAAYVLGLGQPAWVVQAHALLNVLCWLALAFVLLRWFPLTSWENVLRWAAVMFSHGVIMSVRHSLVDGPSLLLVALALRWLEDGKQIAGATTLALAGLGKETSLLASAGIDFAWNKPSTWGRPVLTVIAIAVPLALWMGFIKWKFGPAEDPGMGNFTAPLLGFVEKANTAWEDLQGDPTWTLNWAVAATVVALAVQWLFLALRWRPDDRWWRVGAAFALMMVFLSTPVWEGYPGASTRVLLPMTLAFNVLVPRGLKWLPVLLLGNMTVAASIYEFSPPHDFYTVRGPAGAEVRVVPEKGWHGPERHLQGHWRWSAGRGELRLINSSGRPLLVAMNAEALSVEGERRIRVMLGDRLLWSEPVGAQTVIPVRFGLTLQPGETTLVFSSDRPGQKVGTDPRDLAFQISNLDIVVKPAAR
ncbi:MAG: hypothetical protein V4773_26715 [Verrucomicrobiota bacterium]